MRWITPLPSCGPARCAAGRLDRRDYGRSGTAPTGRVGPAQAIDRGASLSDPSDPRDGAVAATGTPGRRPRTRLLLLLALAVLALDLVTKLLVVATIERGADIRLLGGALYLTHARNTGAAFSFAEGFTVVFTLIAVAVAVVIVRTARRLFSTGWAVALGLVLASVIQLMTSYPVVLHWSLVQLHPDLPT